MQVLMFTVITVMDDDTAGIEMGAQVLTIQENGIFESVAFLGLSSKPVGSVKVQIQIDAFIAVTPRTFVIGKSGKWKNINQQISFQPELGHHLQPLV